jgi:hypothetical protein
LMEGSGSVQINYGSGSSRPKNIRIRNTAANLCCFFPLFRRAARQAAGLQRWVCSLRRHDLPDGLWYFTVSTRLLRMLTVPHRRCVIIFENPLYNERVVEGGGEEAKGPMYFVFCRLYPSPPPPATTAVIGSYLSSLYSSLTLYRGCGLAYPYDYRGFDGKK